MGKGKFLTEVGLEIRDLKIIGGYSMLSDGLSVAECTSENGTVFSSGDWKVTLNRVSTECAGARIRVVSETYRRGINEYFGWLLLGTREGCKSTKFIPNTRFDPSCRFDVVEDTLPDGEYDFEFNVADSRYTVLISDGDVETHQYYGPTHEPRILYTVEDATWVTYVTSHGKCNVHESTLVTELDPAVVQEALDFSLGELGAVELVDLLGLWSDLLELD